MITTLAFCMLAWSLNWIDDMFVRKFGPGYKLRGSMILGMALSVVGVLAAALGWIFGL
jgi:hypothetical protein